MLVEKKLEGENPQIPKIYVRKLRNIFLNKNPI